jgi:hypothetical protein
MITNTTTIETKPFSGLWLSNVLVRESKANISAIPYNGTHALVSPVLRRNVTLSENLFTEIRNAVKHASGSENDLIKVAVYAPFPDRPIIVIAFLKDVVKPFTINNAYKLAESDPVFAQAFQSIMYQLGNLITKED